MTQDHDWCEAARKRNTFTNTMGGMYNDSLLAHTRIPEARAGVKGYTRIERILAWPERNGLTGETGYTIQHAGGELTWQPTAVFEAIYGEIRD